MFAVAPGWTLRPPPSLGATFAFTRLVARFRMLGPMMKIAPPAKLVPEFAVKTDREMVALPATTATAPPALPVLPDMVTRSSTRTLLVLVRIRPPLLAAPLLPFR